MKQPFNLKIKDKHDELKKDVPIYTLLVDGNNLLEISYHGDKRINSYGQHIGAIYQFLLQLRKQISIRPFNHVYIMWDGKFSGKLRWELYEDYKKNRGKVFTEYEENLLKFQQKVVNYSNQKNGKNSTSDKPEFLEQKIKLQQYLEELFIRQIEIEEIEGDDLIAYYVNNKSENELIYIVSGDKDIVQLIDDKVCVYSPNLKKYITNKNHIEYNNIIHSNVLLMKILCGDNSDNIKGIKGLGEGTLFKHFPEIKTENIDLDFIINKAKTINEERVKDKKKPLKVCENIVNKVTDGIQGEGIYEINRKIMDLKNPLIHDDAINELNEIINAPIDGEGRSFENLYNLIVRDDILDLLDSNRFSNFFLPFKNVIDREKII